MSHLLQSTIIPTKPPSLHLISSTQHGGSIRATRLGTKSKIREIFMPALSSTMTEGKIVSWVKSEGDKLNKGESVVVVESDKADMDVESFYDAYLTAIIVDEGSSAPVGSAFSLLAESEDEIALAKSQNSSAATSPPSASSATSSSESDSADSSAVASIVDESFAPRKMELKESVVPGVAAKEVEASSAVVERDKKVGGGVALGSVVPFTTMQNAVSRNMVESLAVPTFRVGYTITTDALAALYKKIKSKGVTMTALLAKAIALALLKHPVVNSSCRDGKSFTYNSSINIAVAAAIDSGLITPVIQDADKVDIYSLSRKWKELVDKARAKQLKPHEYSTDITKIQGDVGIPSICIWAISCVPVSWFLSAQTAFASEIVGINAVYEIGELFELGIQLTYLLLLLLLLGVGSFFVIRQVLVRRELDLSAKELQEQVRSGDASAMGLFELGAVMLRRKFYPAAIKYLLQAIDKWDGDQQDLAQVYNALGVSYVLDGKVDKGIVQFENAVKLQPGYVIAWNNLGDAYEKKKEITLALKAFDEALLFDPNNKVARPRRDALSQKAELYKGIPMKSKKTY